MDATTAQAIHELATIGRLSEDSREAVSDALNLPRFDGIDAKGNDVRPVGVTAEGESLNPEPKGPEDAKSKGTTDTKAGRS
jgi:hypothetical protein